MAATKPGLAVTARQATLVMRRVFAASRRRVFDAMTRPEHIPHWYGPPGVSVCHCESDLRVGGAYRIALRTADGAELGFKGVYREIVPPERRVYTWAPERMPEREALVTETFHERDSKTSFTATIVFKAVADRDR